MAYSEHFTAPLRGTGGTVPVGDTGEVLSVRSIDEVLTRMGALAAGWPPADGAAVFHHVYLAVTETAGRSTRRGRLGDAASAATLDLRLAARYLAALEAVAVDHRTPACWRPLFRYRRHPGVLPLQFALAGINAHIGHDLALAVVDACRALDCAPQDLEDEFDRVGELAVALEERIREEVMPGPDLLQVVDPLTHLVGCWSLERARDGAWSAAKALWALREQPALADEFAQRLDAAVGVVGHLLLTPLPLPHRAPYVPFSAAQA